MILSKKLFLNTALPSFTSKRLFWANIPPRFQPKTQGLENRRRFPFPFQRRRRTGKNPSLVQLAPREVQMQEERGEKN